MFHSLNLPRGCSYLIVLFCCAPLWTSHSISGSVCDELIGFPFIFELSLCKAAYRRHCILDGELVVVTQCHDGVLDCLLFRVVCDDFTANIIHSAALNYILYNELWSHLLVLRKRFHLFFHARDELLKFLVCILFGLSGSLYLCIFIFDEFLIILEKFLFDHALFDLKLLDHEHLLHLFSGLHLLQIDQLILLFLFLLNWHNHWLCLEQGRLPEEVHIVVFVVLIILSCLLFELIDLS